MPVFGAMSFSLLDLSGRGFPACIQCTSGHWHGRVRIAVTLLTPHVSGREAGSVREGDSLTAKGDARAVPSCGSIPELLEPATAVSLDLHAHPDYPARRNVRRAGWRSWLVAEGFQVTSNVGGHGVVGVLHNGDGPVVLVRTELDALPIEESSGLPYRSAVTATDTDGRSVPVMHACGHDVHVAAAAGAAALLARGSAHWRGTLIVIGQPAEETLQGARAMLEDGLYSRFPLPSVALAQHSAPFPAGMVAHATEAITAGSVSLRVVIHGRGGHASTPHLAVDPIIVAASVVLRLRGIVAQETEPDEPAVVRVGSVHARHSRQRGSRRRDAVCHGPGIVGFCPGPDRVGSAAGHCLGMCSGGLPGRTGVLGCVRRRSTFLSRRLRPSYAGRTRLSSERIG